VCDADRALLLFFRLHLKNGDLLGAVVIGDGGITWRANCDRSAFAVFKDSQDVGKFQRRADVEGQFFDANDVAAATVRFHLFD